MIVRYIVNVEGHFDSEDVRINIVVMCDVKKKTIRDLECILHKIKTTYAIDVSLVAV